MLGQEAVRLKKKNPPLVHLPQLCPFFFVIHVPGVRIRCRRRSDLQVASGAGSADCSVIANEEPLVLQSTSPRAAGYRRPLLLLSRPFIGAVIKRHGSAKECSE